MDRAITCSQGNCALHKSMSLKEQVGAEFQARFGMGLAVGASPREGGRFIFFVITESCGFDGQAPLILVSSGVATEHGFSCLS